MEAERRIVRCRKRGTEARRRLRSPEVQILTRRDVSISRNELRIMQLSCRMHGSFVSGFQLLPTAFFYSFYRPEQSLRARCKTFSLHFSVFLFYCTFLIRYRLACLSSTLSCLQFRARAWFTGLVRWEELDVVQIFSSIFDISCRANVCDGTREWEISKIRAYILIIYKIITLELDEKTFSRQPHA